MYLPLSLLGAPAPPPYPTTLTGTPASVLTHVPDAEKPSPQRVPELREERDPSGQAGADTRDDPSPYSEVTARSRHHGSGQLRQPPGARECPPGPRAHLRRGQRSSVRSPPSTRRREHRCRHSQRPAGLAPGPRPPAAGSLGAQGLAELQPKAWRKRGDRSPAPPRGDGTAPPSGQEVYQ